MNSSNEKDLKHDAQHVADVYDEVQKGPAVQETQVASVALAQAIEQQKPSLWSSSMRKLYMIVSAYTSSITQIQCLTQCFPTDGCWLLGLNDERIRLIPDGCHQCYGQLVRIQ